MATSCWSAPVTPAASGLAWKTPSWPVCWWTGSSSSLWWRVGEHTRPSGGPALLRSRLTGVTDTERNERAALALIAVLILALGFRIYLLTGPFGQIDADEAVVGLMALEMPQE